MRELTYKDTENSVEIVIFGLKFKINNSEIEKLNADEIEKKVNENDKVLEEIIDKILGEGSVSKINEKRKNDGFDEMDVKIEMQVFSFIMEIYAEEILKPVNKTVNKFRGYKNNVNKFKNYNRYRR